MRKILAVIVVSLACAVFVAEARPPGDSAWQGPASVSPNHDMRVDPSANTTVVQTEVCFDVTGVTTITPLADRKDITFWNKSSSKLTLSFDADNPTSVGVGIPIAAGEGPIGFGHGDNIVIKGIANGTSMTTPNCVEVLQSK